MTDTALNAYEMMILFSVGDRNIMVSGLSDSNVGVQPKEFHLEFARILIEHNENSNGSPMELVDSCIHLMVRIYETAVQRFHEGDIDPWCKDDEDLFLSGSRDLTNLLIACERLTGKQLVDAVISEHFRVSEAGYTGFAAGAGHLFQGETVLAEDVRASKFSACEPQSDKPEKKRNPRVAARAAASKRGKRQSQKKARRNLRR